MSIVKSYSVGNGDMFFVDHNSPNLTIIDCCIGEEDEERILSEIATRATKDKIVRFISTHPDEDHVRGLELLDQKIGILNFYSVENDVATADETPCFKKYRELHDSDKTQFIYKDLKRKWMNQGDEQRKQSGIDILWPNLNNKQFKSALQDAKNGYSPNNISPIIQYSLAGGVNILWMGDLETDFLESIEDELTLPKVTVLFAPHHGRDSGKIPKSMLDQMSPEIIVVGEAPSKYLHYYPDHDTITQNTAGDIIFDCQSKKIHVFTSNEYYVDFLLNESMRFGNYHYLGTLNL